MKVECELKIVNFAFWETDYLSHFWVVKKDSVFSFEASTSFMNVDMNKAELTLSCQSDVFCFSHEIVADLLTNDVVFFAFESVK